MFSLSNGWRHFAEDKLRLYLERELAWELAENPLHTLASRQIMAVALNGWDDIVLRLDGRDEFAWVHLTWNGEKQPQWPQCELLGEADAVDRFMAEWQPSSEEAEVQPGSGSTADGEGR